MKKEVKVSLSEVKNIVSYVEKIMSAKIELLEDQKYYYIFSIKLGE